MGASTGIVASGHAETSAAGRVILEQGGNAFDAALGALCAATVCEPLLTSLAGGGFLLARPAGGEPEVFDFFVQTPSRKLPAEALDFHPILADFGTTTQEFHVGLGSSAVPGIAAGLVEVHAALGSMPLTEIVAPAVRLARDGVRMTRYQAHISEILLSILSLSPGAMALVAGPEDRERPARAGELVRHPELADTLEALAREGRDWFYQGAPARRLLADCEERGGQLQHCDLADYRVIRRRPVHAVGLGGEFWFNAPPSPGGSLLAFALALLEPVTLAPGDAGGARHCLAVAGAMEAANRLRARSESGEMGEWLAVELASEERLAEWRALAMPEQVFRRGTTHLSVVDGQGNLASLTTSNGEGCGYVIPGTGVMMNNMLGEEDLNPRGFHRWQPGHRLASMMCPTLARLPDGSEVALGTGGSNRIRSAVLQVLLNLCAFGLAPRDAVAASRMHLEGERLSFEAGVDAAAVAALHERWPDAEAWPEPSLFFGGVHLAGRSADGQFLGAGDPRRGGEVALAGAVRPAAGGENQGV